MSALITLNEVTVNWVADSGKSFEVTETVTTNSGASWPRKWGVVLEGAGVQVGDVINVSGEYSDKIDEYNGKHFTKRTLWNPTVTRETVADVAATLGANEVTDTTTPF